MKHNRNFTKGIKKTKAGNYFGYYKGYWIFIFRRQHGAWCCQIGKKKVCMYGEGYHATSLRTVTIAKQWAKTKI